MKFCFPFSRFRIEGDSMFPSYRSGDRVLVLRWGTLSIDDTAVFYKNGMAMVKRAVQREDDHWVMRGDNFSASSDSIDFGRIRKDQIIGKVIAKY